MSYAPILKRKVMDFEALTLWKSNGEHVPLNSSGSYTSSSFINFSSELIVSRLNVLSVKADDVVTGLSPSLKH